MASDQTSDPAALHFVTTPVILESSFSGNGSSNSRGFLGPLTIMSFRISNVPRFNDCFCVRNKKNQINAFIQQDKGRPLPKFGEWDVNNPASAEGFTVIFNKARDEKKTNGQGGATIPPQKPTGGYKPDHDYDFPTKSKWFCCG